MDFEAYAQKMCSMGLRKNVPVIMCSVWDSYLKKLYTLYVKNPKWKIPFKPEPIIKKHEIIPYKSEGFLFEGLVGLVDELDPDLFTAWNLDRYDFPKWKTRMEACHLNPRVLSPFKSFAWRREPYRIKGRILFDLMKGFKRFTDAELRSYSLAYVIDSENLTAEKIPFTGTPADTWDKYPQVMFKRNVNDVIVLKELDEKYDLIETFDDLRRVFGALFHEVLMNYRVLDTALMRFVNGKVALRTVHRKKTKKKSFLGAVVIEPEPGLYPWMVQFDFSREYPNIIRALNIGPETYRANGKGYYKVTAPDGTIHSFVRSPRSLLAQLIDDFFRQRDMYEKAYEEAIESGNKTDIKAWWRRVFNIKKMTNAIYGVMDFDGFRLSKGECSAAVALVGREAIHCLNDIAKSLGYELKYGDTDSIFVFLKGKYGWKPKALLKEGEWLRDKFNEGLTKYFKEKHRIPEAPLDLGLKKLYSRFLLIAKKSYAGKCVWDEKKGWSEGFEFKGIEVIRSDSSMLEKDTLETIIKMTLSEKSMEDTKQYWGGIAEDFEGRKYHYLEVAYPLQIKKPFNQYTLPGEKKKKSAPAHARSALYSNRFLNTDFEQGDKPRRLPINVGEHITAAGQTTLGGDVQRYPLKWTYKDENGSFTWKLRDISVAEDMVVPFWFLERIDWDRIFNRLENKVNKILALIEGFKWVGDGPKEK